MLCLFNVSYVLTRGLIFCFAKYACSSSECETACRVYVYRRGHCTGVSIYVRAFVYAHVRRYM